MHQWPFYCLPYLCEAPLTCAQWLSGWALSNCYLKDVQETAWENSKCGAADCHFGYVILGFHVRADLPTDNLPSFLK